MNWIIPASKVEDSDRKRIGGKAFALATMSRGGFRIPETICIASGPEVRIPAGAYFIYSNALNIPKWKKSTTKPKDM